MEVHPRFGAEVYEIALGQMRYRQGWNAIRQSASRPATRPAVMYMWVSPDGGLFTPNKPSVPDDEIHTVSEDDLPEVEQTLAWQQTERFAKAVIALNLPEYPLERVSQVMDNIRRLGTELPLRSDDGSIEGFVDQAKAHMKKTVTSAGPTIPTVNEFFRPAENVVLEYMDFRISGVQAHNSLNTMLATACWEFPSPIAKERPAGRFISCCRHLLTRTYALLKQRDSFSLGAYYDATYLALMYGNTAIVGYKNLIHYAQLTDIERKKIEGEMYAVDEQMAHYASPSLLHPIHLLPSGIAEIRRRLRLSRIATEGLYPGAQQCKDGSLPEPSTILKQIQEHSSRSEGRDIRGSVTGENSFLSDELREDISMFLITMALGRGGP